MRLFTDGKNEMNDDQVERNKRQIIGKAEELDTCLEKETHRS
jgi:hypothetical protein